MTDLRRGYRMRPTKGTELLLVLSVVVLPLCHSQAQEKEVIVIGGGIAGLAAARQIANHGRGKFSVRVYEARRERYGGRVWTNKLKNPKARGLEVDLGAFALNTGSPFTNPLLNLTRDFELETATLRGAQFVVPSLNKKYSGDELTKIFSAVSAILTEGVNRTRVSGKDVSIRAMIDSELKERGIEPQHPHALLLRSLKTYLIPDYSARLYEPYALDFRYNQVLLDGMSELLDRLVSGTEDERPLKISLRTVVRQVKVDRSNDKVIIRLRDGSQVMADEVVVAVPAPVITRGELLFEPPLPKPYVTALNSIKMAASNKVIVEFDKVFWSGDHAVFLTGEEAKEGGEECGGGCLQTWFNVHQVLGLPVLFGFVAGKAAVDMETLSDQDLHDLVLKKLQRTFGEGSVSSENIVKISRTAWMSDPFCGGASSYPSVGDTGDLWDSFSEPWCPHVYFAGEHTLFRHHGTLHGAYNSGLRAADQILSGYCARKAEEEERRRKEEERKKAKMNKTDGQDDGEKDEDELMETVKNDSSEDVKDEL